MVSAEKEILQFLHCALCMAEVTETLKASGKPQSPAQYQRLEVGFTPAGLQVWCSRHDCNIVHIDFQGQKHPANVSRKAQS